MVDGDTHSLTIRLAGTFTPSEELNQAAGRADALNQRLIDRVRSAGAIRPDIDPADLRLLFEQLAAIRLGDQRRTVELRRRYAALLLEALRTEGGPPLPGSPPTWEEIGGRWRPAERLSE